MPPRSNEWMRRIKDAEKEFHVAKMAADLLRVHLLAHPSALADRQLRPRDAERFAKNLEPTYLVRVYAEFEACLRESWRRAFGRRTFPKMEILIERVGDLRRIPPIWIANAHQVRNYRNDIVHDVKTGTAMLPLDRARSHLCSFISRLSLDW
jgi:hypothetical protein